MVIYATKPYEGGNFFQYLNIGLVPIDKNAGKAIEENGKAIIYSVEEASDFYDKMGRNTGYIIDPEEVLLSVDKPSGKLIFTRTDTKNGRGLQISLSHSTVSYLIALALLSS